MNNSAGNLEMMKVSALRLFGSWIVEIKDLDANTIADVYNRTLKASLHSFQKK
jgi:hypothetical protein